MSINIATTPTLDRPHLSGPIAKCGVCQTVVSKYTCPRCNLSYCSVECFKHEKHAGCSESFYKDCFETELKQNKATNEEKRHIMRLLKEFEENDHEPDIESLQERLEGVNLDKIEEEDLWRKLTKEEQDEFLGSINRGDCEKFIAFQKPWWTYHNTDLITVLDHQDEDVLLEASDKRMPLPELGIQVPKLSELLRSKPASPLVCNNLINVLYSYAFCHRYFNGNSKEFAEEFSYNTIRGSVFLKSGQSLVTCEEAIFLAIGDCTKLHEGNTEKQMTIEVILDVFHILLGKDRDNPGIYASLSLSELHCVCKRLKIFLKTEKHSYDLSSKSVFQAIKRLEFLFAWVEENSSNLLPLALQIMTVYKKQKISFETHKEEEANVDKLRRDHILNRPKNKPLIQEIK